MFVEGLVPFYCYFFKQQAEGQSSIVAGVAVAEVANKSKISPPEPIFANHIVAIFRRFPPPASSVAGASFAASLRLACIAAICHGGFCSTFLPDSFVTEIDSRTTVS
mmetsp:Transcript_15105/g.35025  ORF Transcript_15105/g.35025 Transcript_15105/m.35025 type:complete len:107 (+) Transcript_15105:1590-1910(+)